MRKISRTLRVCVRVLGAAFDALTTGKKKMCLYYLNDAKKPETRTRRIAELVARLTSARVT